MSRRTIGLLGEQKAVDYLINRGFRIVDRNVHIGRGEIDVIANDGDTWVFVEVKTGRTTAFGEPEERVTTSKQRQLGRLAQQYLDDHGLADVECRFDVVAIKSAGHGWKVRYIENAFWLERE